MIKKQRKWECVDVWNPITRCIESVYREASVKAVRKSRKSMALPRATKRAPALLMARFV